MKLKLDTLYALFFSAFILGMAALVAGSTLLMDVSERYLGFAGRVIVAVIALLVFFFVLMRWFYRFGDRLDERARAEAREKYRGIYHVLALPTASKKPANWCAEEITIGDYGWESKPLTKDGLIWLHGLSTEWKMAWRAGFKPEEVEFVCSKPVSQYDWKDFEYNGPKPSSIWTTAIPKQPCPFPIQKAISDRRLQFPITCA